MIDIDHRIFLGIISESSVFDQPCARKSLAELLEITGPSIDEVSAWLQDGYGTKISI